jgi:hypothetical protein
MDPTALYYALSTIAQCAAALAAVIGSISLAVTLVTALRLSGRFV